MVLKQKWYVSLTIYYLQIGSLARGKRLNVNSLYHIYCIDLGVNKNKG